MRNSGWEDRLTEVIMKHQALPGEYGTSDCWLIADDSVEACVGKRMAEIAGQKPVGKYKTEAGAAKALRRRGFESVDQAFALVFPSIGVLSAQRGDLGVIEQEGVRIGGVFTALGFFTRFDFGTTFLPVTQVSRAFKVE